MKLRLLMSVSIAALLASSFVARADDLETYQSALTQLTAIPEEARSAEAKQDIQKLQTLVQQQSDVKKNVDLITQTGAQISSLQQTYANSQPAYDAQAKVVEEKLDRIDALNKVFSGAKDASARLTIAIKQQVATEQKYQSMSPNDPGFAAADRARNAARYAAEVAADVVKANGLSALQDAQRDYNDAKAQLDQLNSTKNDAGQKLQAARATLSHAQDAIGKANAAINQLAPASQGGVSTLIAKATVDANNNRTQVVQQATSTSVLTGEQGAKLLNIVNAEQLVSTGGINLAALDPKQRAAMDASGASKIARNGVVSASDLTPDMLSKIVASGAGNITVQGGFVTGSGTLVAPGAGTIAQLVAVANIVASGAGNIVASGAGNIVASGAGNIVASGAGNIISTNGGGIVASGAGNLGAIMNSAMANARDAETALLTAGVQASLIGKVGASLIANDVAKGLITNDGGSLITNDGGSLAKLGAQGVIGNDGASAIARNAAAAIGSNVADLVVKNVAAGNIVASGAGNIVASGAGNIVASGAGNIVATGAGNFNSPPIGFVPSMGAQYKAVSPEQPSGGGTPVAAAASTPPAAAVATSTQPRGVPGGGFKQDTVISITGAYDGPNARTSTPPATTVVASAPTTTMQPVATTPAPVTTSPVTSAAPKGYDPNDWTTWPKADVASFLPPGKSVQQFKASAEQDLATYKKDLAALPATGLSKSQQDQKAGMEAQIRSLEFQVDTANRALGLPNSTTAAVKTGAPPPTPVMSASAIAATVKLPTDLAAAVQGLNDRSQQIASATQDLTRLQMERKVATDPAQQKGLDSAISSAKFQIDVMQQALDRENKNVADLQQSTTKTATLAPAAPAAPVMSASAIAATVTLPSDLAAAQQRVNDRSQQMASANQQLQQWQAQRATTTDPEKLKGLDAAISGAKFQIDVMQQALDRENKNVADLQASASKTAALTPPAATPPAVPAAAPAQAAVPLKITTTEQKGLEQALRTIPGKLSAPEKKTFNSLSVLAQKAVSKGLTPAEGAELLSGIRALAQKHPKGIERYKLTNLANPRHEGGGRAGTQEHPVQTHAVVPAAHGPSPAATAPVHPAAIARQMPEPAVVKPEALKPHEVHAHPAAPEHGHGAAPAHAVRPEPPKPVMAHQHPAVAPKPETAHHHAPVAHMPAQAKPVAAPPKPHVANVPKPVAAAVPPKPKAVVAPPKPAAPVMQPIRH